MDHSRQNQTTKGSEERSLHTVNILTNILIVTSLLFIVFYSIYVIYSTPASFAQEVSSFFHEHIVFGDYIYNFLINHHIINISHITQTYVLPVAIIDVLLFALPFLFLQSCVYLLKRRMLKKDNAIIGAAFALLLMFAMLAMQGKAFSVLELILKYDFQLRTRVLFILLLFQLISFILLIYYLIKLGKIDPRKILSHTMASTFIRLGAIPALVTFTILAGGLIYAKNQTNTIRETIQLDYTIDLTKATDGKLSIQVPNKITKVSDYAGINIPKEITNVTVLKALGIDTIDVGGIINAYTLPQFDNMVQIYIDQPLWMVIIGAFLTILILLGEYLSKRLKHQALLFYILEGIIVIFLFTNIPNYFPIMLEFFTSIVFFGILLHYIVFLQKQKIFEGIQKRFTNK